VALIGEYDYSEPAVQSTIEWMTSAVEKSNEKLGDDIYTDSWLRAFLQFVQRSNEMAATDDETLNITGMRNFTSVLKRVSIVMLIIRFFFHDNHHRNLLIHLY
jgi:hypothetical protein